MKNKLLKPLLTIASISTVAAPVATLSSCWQKEEFDIVPEQDKAPLKKIDGDIGYAALFDLEIKGNKNKAVEFKDYDYGTNAIFTYTDGDEKVEVDARIGSQKGNSATAVVYFEQEIASTVKGDLSFEYRIKGENDFKSFTIKNLTILVPEVETDFKLLGAKVVNETSFYVQIRFKGTMDEYQEKYKGFSSQTTTFEINNTSYDPITASEISIDENDPIFTITFESDTLKFNNDFSGKLVCVFGTQQGEEYQYVEKNVPVEYKFVPFKYNNSYLGGRKIKTDSNKLDVVYFEYISSQPQEISNLAFSSTSLTFGNSSYYWFPLPNGSWKLVLSATLITSLTAETDVSISFDYNDETSNFEDKRTISTLAFDPKFYVSQSDNLIYLNYEKDDPETTWWKSIVITGLYIHQQGVEQRIDQAGFVITNQVSTWTIMQLTNYVSSPQNAFIFFTYSYNNKEILSCFNFTCDSW